MNSQLSYEQRQDTTSNKLQLPKDGKLVVIKNGSLWKDLHINPFTITEQSLILFWFSLTKEAEFHDLCVDFDSEFEKGPRCFMFSGALNGNKKLICKGIEETLESYSCSCLLCFNEYHLLYQIPDVYSIQ